MMFLGYNTNGLAHHALADAAELLAKIGYRGMAITLDHDWVRREGMDFYLREDVEKMVSLCQRWDLKTVVETGARFLLDPCRKHQPNLLDPNPAQRQFRQRYYQLAIQVAHHLKSDAVSIWSGTAPGEEIEGNGAIWDERLVRELIGLLDYAQSYSVRIALEPEPGMWIAEMSDFGRLLSLLEQISPSHAQRLFLTVDIGHLYCQGEPIRENLRKYASQIANIHLDDARRGVHEHLFPGEGEVDFAEVLDVLREIGYSGGVYVELSRHSATAPTTAWEAFVFLNTLMT